MERPQTTNQMPTSRRLCWAVALAAAVPLRAGGQGMVQGAVTLQGRPLAGVVIRLFPVEELVFPDVADTALIDQRNLRFIPGVLAVRTGTTLDFRNSDQIMHNVFSPQRRGAGFDLGTYPQYESRSFTFAEPGIYVVLCHVHPEMAAWIIVTATPFHAVTDPNGRFQIEGMRPGSYRMQTWHQRGIEDERLIEITQDNLASVGVELRSRN